MQKKENQKEPVPAEKTKTKRKKKGKVAEVYSLHQKGISVKQIAKKTKLSEQIVRSYIWRAKNPEKYKALLKRYFEKKKTKQANELRPIFYVRNESKASAAEFYGFDPV